MSMTREEAIDLVFDLISAVRDLEVMNNSRRYREHYEQVREKIIDALSPRGQSND